VSLNAALTHVAAQEPAQPKPQYLRFPSGRRYKLSRTLTQAEVDQVAAYEQTLVDRDKALAPFGYKPYAVKEPQKPAAKPETLTHAIKSGKGRTLSPQEELEQAKRYNWSPDSISEAAQRLYYGGSLPGDPNRTGLENIPLPPSTTREAVSKAKAGTEDQVQRGAKAFVSAASSAAVATATALTGGLAGAGAMVAGTALRNIAVDATLQAVFGTPTEADAAFALLPQAFRGIKAILPELKTTVRAGNAARAWELLDAAALDAKAQQDVMDRLFPKTRLKQLEPKNAAALDAKVKGEPVRQPAGDASFGLATKFEPEGANLPKSGISLDEIGQKGKQIIAKDPGAARKTLDKVKSNAQTLSPDEISVLAAHGTLVKNRIAQIESQLDKEGLSSAERAIHEAELSGLQDDINTILDGGTIAQKTFHQTGQALKVAFQPDFSGSVVQVQAKRANLGEALKPETAATLKGYTDRIATIEKELGAARTEVETMIAKLGAAPRKAAGSTGTKKGDLIKGILGDFGLGGEAQVGAGMASKRAGAINVSNDVKKRLTTRATQLAKMYLEEGASTLDDVLQAFQRDLPQLDTDTVLGLLSQKYRTTLLESDVHKISVNRALATIRRRADFRQKSLLGKAADIAGESLIATQRGMQAGFDLSAFFMQGLPGGIAHPKTWATGLPEAFKPIVGKYGAYNEVVAKLQRDPAYKRAVKAGLSMTDVHGPVTVQEEIFMGNLVERLREWGAERPAWAKALTAYPEGLGRTNEAFAAFMNKQRMELFKKIAGPMIDDPEGLKDAARLTNILTGRGDGKMASALSNKQFAMMFYAPRYMLSTFQNAALPLLLPTFKTARGKRLAMEAWGKQAATLVGGLALAKQFGLQVDDDVRSADYGTIKLPGGQTVNLFRKIAEPVRLGAQLYGGKISSKDSYKEAGFYNGASVLGQFMLGKASPAARLASNQVFGERYDAAAGKSVPFDVRKGSDLSKTAQEMFIPLAWQQAMESEGDMSAFVAALLGLDVRPKGNRVIPKGAYPLKRPGG